MKPSKVCAAMLCGVFGAALFTTPALAAAAPNDLRHHWAQTQVYTLMEHGIIAGYSDHTFRPDQPVTRQEAAGLVYGLLEEMGVELDDEAEIPVFGGTTEDIPQQVLEDWEKYHNSLQRPSEPEEGEEETTIPGDDVTFPTYTDLDDSWAKDKILCLEANGVLPEDGTGLFRPFQNLTRGEAAQILYNSICRWPELFSLTPVTESPDIHDMDGRPDAEAVLSLARLGVVSGRGDGSYCPDDSISRAEFSVLLLNLAGYPLMTDVEFDPLPACTVIPTPYISQVYPSAAWVGCEPTSLLMGLKAKGYAQNVTLDQFLADLKVKSCDIEAWSPRQQKYFEVCSCSNLGDAQARRLKMRVKGEKGTYLPHTLNNTVVAPPRMLIAFLENNLQADGSVKIPEVLRPYMGGKELLIPKK